MLLFGDLKDGGNLKIDANSDDQLVLTAQKETVPNAEAVYK